MEENKNNYAFISYSSKNQQTADSVRLLLIDNGISCWMAPYDIPAGSKYAEVINDALEKCSCLVLLLTNAAQESQFVEREVERAITYNKTIIPVQLENVTLNSGFRFYIGNSQIIAVPSIDNYTDEIQKVVSSIRRCLEENNVSDDKHKVFLESIKVPLEKSREIKSAVWANDYFFKLSLLSDDGGSLFIYSPECHFEADKVKINITEEIWNSFERCCKNLITAAFPGVTYNQISIKKKKELGEYLCAPDDGYNHYNEQYRLDFEISFIRNNYEKYDSVRFDIGSSFEVSLFHHGNYAYRDTNASIKLADFGIDEIEMINAAEEMIRFVTRKKDVIISNKFRRNIFSDGSGGYFLDFVECE